MSSRAKRLHFKMATISGLVCGAVKGRAFEHSSVGSPHLQVGHSTNLKHSKSS